MRTLLIISVFMTLQVALSTRTRDQARGEEQPCVDGQHTPHEIFCAKFYDCNNGVLAEVDCIPGLVFNPEAGFCDFPGNVDCVDAEIPVEDGGGPVGECPEENPEFVLHLADSADCTIFYKCDWGKAIKYSCPSGLNFNPTLQVCDWPENAGCNAV